MLDPNIRENFRNAEIRDVFNRQSGKVGCYVTEGNVKRGAGVRLLRDNVTHEGKLKTLKRFKDDVKEVGTSFECGMAFENYEDIKVGDVIEAFELIDKDSVNMTNINYYKMPTQRQLKVGEEISIFYQIYSCKIQYMKMI